MNQKNSENGNRAKSLSIAGNDFFIECKGLSANGEQSSFAVCDEKSST
jgi:hypothetical protein